MNLDNWTGMSWQRVHTQIILLRVSIVCHSICIFWMHLRNKFHFSDFLRFKEVTFWGSRNATGHMQSKWRPKGIKLTSHGTSCVHTSINLRKMKFISYIYTVSTSFLFIRPKKNICVFQVSSKKKLGMVGRNNILFCQNILFGRWCQNWEAVRKTTWNIIDCMSNTTTQLIDMMCI